MSVLIVSEMNTCVSSLLGNAFIVEETLGSYDGTVVDAHDLPLQNSGNGELDDGVKSHRSLVEHLRDDGHRAMGGLAYSQREGTAGASHSGNDKPVA